MKPIYIEMKAFGSYRDEKIDFTGKSQGLFLITGDTGAGKTTIFDAICYALYGETSGGKRSGEMMCSQFAKPGEKTEVRFCFDYDGRKYLVTRSPDQPKWNKKGERLKTTTGTKVSLILPDGTEFAGKTKETNEKIQQIIGLGCNQFTQIAMLAKGDFIKLLHATSEERKEIFARIFDTSIYEQIQRELALEAKSVYGKLIGNREDIIKELGRIQAVDAVLDEQWNDLEVLFSETHRDELLALAKRICEDSNQQLGQVENDKENVGKTLEKISAQIEAGTNINRLFEELERHHKKAEQLSVQKETVDVMRLKLDAGRRAMVVDKDAKIVTERRKESADCKQRLEQLKQWFEENVPKMEQIENDYRSLGKQLETEVPVLEEKVRVRKEGLIRLQEIQKLQAEFMACQGKLQEAETLLQQSEQEYEEIHVQIMDNQALQLRLTLVEGEPCPVCGNVHHPVMEHDVDHDQKSDRMGSADAAFETMVEQERRLQSKREQDQKQVVQLQQKLAGIQGKWEALQSQLHDDEMPTVSQRTIQDAVLQDIPDQFQNDLNEWQARIAQIKQKAAAAEKKHEKFAREKQEREGERKAETAHLERCVEAVAQAETAYTQSLTEQDFENEEAYQNARMDKQRLDAFQQQINEYEQACKLTEERVRDLEQQTKDKKPIELQQLLQQREELGRRQKSLEAQVKELYHVAKENERAYEAGTKLYEKRDSMKRRAEILANLDNTANGRISKRHVNFQTYIQRRYFAQIIDRANQRLVRMTNHQFELRCRDLEHLRTVGQVGLDLDVYSIVNDQVRDVKTLSGGESFVAALAMALGMADMIQDSRGSVHIDTMFIDEGFGALSEETRNQAIAVLNELSGGKRMVGIISHVSELKAQVGTKLVVTRTDKGSHAHWEMD